MAYHKASIAFFILYILVMTALMIWLGLGITPDRYVLMLTLGILFIGKTRKFLLDWLPFLFILISYDFLRSLADHLNTRVHYLELIWADKWLFGVVPTVFLQEKLYFAGKLQWYDFVSVFFYFLHFALPLAFGFILWLKNRAYFKKFAVNLLVLSYAAFFTYVIFPASPPWLSNKMGLLPGVTKILENILKLFPQRLDLPTIYNNFDPNPVAAVPSLHAAYPFLVLLLSLKFFGKKALLFIPYILGVWFSIVYLGEHYVIDVVLGVIYTLVTLLLTGFIHYHLPRLAKLKSFAVAKLLH
ncbi:phosphatase PAP2 family protein [Candidatus Daviesbacteria bacterium]|nr:phosphatase PAP2 family protein [Candidatus Daviesbacteria bacterium]